MPPVSGRGDSQTQERARAKSRPRRGRRRLALAPLFFIATHVLDIRGRDVRGTAGTNFRRLIRLNETFPAALHRDSARGRLEHAVLLLLLPEAEARARL